MQLLSEGLVESFFDAFDGLVTQGKSQMKVKFLATEKTVKSKLKHFFPILN